MYVVKYCGERRHFLRPRQTTKIRETQTKRADRTHKKLWKQLIIFIISIISSFTLSFPPLFRFSKHLLTRIKHLSLSHLTFLRSLFLFPQRFFILKMMIIHLFSSVFSPPHSLTHTRHIFSRLLSKWLVRWAGIWVWREQRGNVVPSTVSWVLLHIHLIKFTQLTCNFSYLCWKHTSSFLKQAFQSLTRSLFSIKPTIADKQETIWKFQ